MKLKRIAVVYLILLSFGTMLSIYIPKTEVAANETIAIPNEAIRLRILANSDSKDDQALKREVRDEVNKEISTWVQDLTSIEEARSVIRSKLPEIQQIAEGVVAKYSPQSVKAEFGKVKFPTKLYGQFLYPAGEYEAILITLGDGKGANWWCVLFPPLCFLDFSNGIAVSDGFEGEKAAAASAPQDSVSNGKKEQVKADGKEAPVDGHLHPVKQQTGSAEQKPIAEDAPKEKTPETAEKAAEEKAQDDKGQNETEFKKNTQDKHKSVKKEQDGKVLEETQEEKRQAKKTAAAKTPVEKAPLYTEQDEQPIEVKFFVKELWKKIF